MGVYIKGLEMPTEEEICKCIIVRHDGEVWTVEFDNLVDGGFVACFPTNPMRAVPVPPHGRLIESKAFLQVVHKTDNFSLDELAHLAVLVAATPTIIPAEEAQP